MSVTEITEYNLQVQVARWSLNNFGAQESKATFQKLFSLAPLLGLIEEALDELLSAETSLESEDALGDVCIYMCDFGSRERPYADIRQIMLDYRYNTTCIDHTEALTTLCKSLGKLCHCVLKRHQGIRGYDKDEKYIAERDQAIAAIMWTAPMVVEVEDNIFDFGVNAFAEIVSKRNWKLNPEGVE